MRRQYSLPNCTLILDGFGDDPPANPGDSRPLLSILTNVECRLIGANKVLQGGRVFLENLVQAVSQYAQEFLSGVRHPQDPVQEPDHVYLEKIGQNLHRLVWYPSTDLNIPESPVKIEISTVQLFDLIEAIDQFFADTRTLPDLTLKLQPVSRRYHKVNESVAGRTVPFLAGLGSLVACALLFYLLPVPQVRKPENPPIPAASPSPTVPTNPVPPPR
ncbi:MAG: DUF4335 domain-containing protein [Microcystis aeruginosa TA09]|nr:MAG: DUF4335 domain-containing protein [Microcystis aeruginosa TA09]